MSSLSRRSLSVVEPVTAEVKAEMTELEVPPGSLARVKAALKNLPAASRIEVRGLPDSITWREIERSPSSVEFELLPSQWRQAHTAVDWAGPLK